ncbi:TonB-dependent receptor [Mucilaginibacter robiniae]|uniref:TonB-dependent receptor n=1 Tax=Mucilaginibacter robiniae TaxID=2728022 RepID=A0A7L5DZP4_9SPHI|nr:outer membrane beta-barrel family protein [Mucilaginibacter robiniae]QJD95698.1 TonB-dependent receptor [Mucilaginibacter robiniae]
MKSLISHLLLLFICSATIAQTRIISGKVIDASQQPLTGATVTLLHLPDSVTTAAKMADAEGKYTFSNIKDGKYIVKASMVSFGSAYTAAFQYKGEAFIVPTLTLADKGRNLKEVTVTSTVPQLQQKSDRLVVNVEKLNTTGDNALDVLKKAPGIRLDKDDNILYRNNAGVVVMIDGRRTYMSSTELSNYLKSMPGNTISKVELIPNPPGNYDAEGTAGMINIILKHNTLQGYSGTANINASYGKYGKVYGGINLNYNTGKFSTYARVNTGYYDSYNKMTLSRQIGSEVYNQYNYWHPKTTSTSYTIGTDFYASKRSTFGVMLKGYNNPTHADVTSQSESYNSAGQQIGSVTGVSPQTSNVGTYNLNLNYSFAIDTIGQKLNMDADYVYSNSTAGQYYTNSYYNGAGILAGAPVQLRNSSPVNYNIKAIKADYVLPLANQWQFEAGLKSSWVGTHSNVVFDSLKTVGYVTDPKRSNDFKYDENINAAYVTFSKPFGKQWDIKASLRAEQTISTANSLTRNEIVKRNYWQLFPSAFVTYKINANNQLNASFSRRISRPNYNSLNSAIRYTDAYTAIQGNPYLQPSISESYVFNYTYKSFQVLSLSYLKVHDDVSNVINQNDQTKESITTYQNLGSTQTLSATSAGSFNIVKWWNVNPEVDAAYNRVNTQVQGVPYVSRRFSWSGNVDQNFFLPQNFKVTLSAQYYSPSISGLSRTLSGSQIDAGVSKTLMDKRMTLSFKVRDIFFGNRYRSVLQYNNVNTRWNNEWESRRFTLGLTYNFGNTKLKAARNRQGGSTAEQGRM